MLEHLDFVIYCIEEYRWAHKLTGRQVLTVFRKYGLYEFIEASYDALHTYGGDSIVWNLDDYIVNHPVAVK